jgi:hypothetical protein
LILGGDSDSTTYSLPVIYSYPAIRFHNLQDLQLETIIKRTNFNDWPTVLEFVLVFPDEFDNLCRLYGLAKQ